MMNIRFLHPASVELDQAICCYELEQENLGKRFLREIQFALKRVMVYPESCEMITPAIRRCMIRRFPYMLLYAIEEVHITIVAVAHKHREPIHWQNIKSSP